MSIFTSTFCLVYKGYQTNFKSNKYSFFWLKTFWTPVILSTLDGFLNMESVTEEKLMTDVERDILFVAFVAYLFYLFTGIWENKIIWKDNKYL